MNVWQCEAGPNYHGIIIILWFISKILRQLKQALHSLESLIYTINR